MLILIILVIYNRNFILNDKLYCNIKSTDFKMSRLDDYTLSQKEINDLCKLIKSPTDEINTKRPFLNITYVDE